MSRPSISVVVRVYNAEELIGASLTAILSQTHLPDEVIVVDDGSTDGTPQELSRFGGAIRVVRQANGGHSAAMNRGFAEARCDYIAICDADDIWEPVKLERHFAALRRHPEIDVAFSAARRFGLTERDHSPPPGNGILDRREFGRILYRGNPVCTSSTLVRRRLFARVGPFNPRLPAAEDYDYLLRALKAGAVFFYQPEVLVRYRQHEAQATRNRLRIERAKFLVHQWHADMIDDARLVRSVHADDLLGIGRQLIDDGRPREARKVFCHSLRYAAAAGPYACGRALSWVTILSLPAVAREQIGQKSIALTAAIRAVRSTRDGSVVKAPSTAL